MPTATKGYLVFIGVLGAMRLIELIWARRNLGSMGPRAQLVPERRFQIMVVVHTAMFVLIPLEIIGLKPSIGGLVSVASAALVVGALALRFWTLKTLGRAWHVRIVKGSELPIVNEGPYRFIRHPNYLVVIMELLFIPLIHQLYVTALVLTAANAWVLWGRIREEEAHLATRPDWIESMQAKPRLIPRFWGRRS